MKKSYSIVALIIKVQPVTMNPSRSLLECTALVTIRASHTSSGTHRKSLYTLNVIIGQKCCNNGEIRLSNDTRLSIMQVVEWRSVWMVYGVQCVMMAGAAMIPPQCADNWDTITVCIKSFCIMTIASDNQNYTVRAIPTRGAYFGEGSGPIHLSRANCNSCHSNLTDCTNSNTGVNGCNHGEDAGVVCMGKTTIQTCKYIVTLPISKFSISGSNKCTDG